MREVCYAPRWPDQWAVRRDMEYEQAISYFRCNDGVVRKNEPYKFWRLTQVGDVLIIKSKGMDAQNVHRSAGQYGIRWGVKLMLKSLGPDMMRVERIEKDAKRIEWGKRGGRPLGAQALAIDNMEVGAALLMPWRVNAAGMRAGQDGLWQLIRRAQRRGDEAGRVYHTVIGSRGVEVKRLK